MTTCQEGATHTNDLRLLRKAAEEGLLYLDVVPLPFVLEIRALVKEYAPDFNGAPMELPEYSAEVYANGVQAFCHANGDAAIELAIEGMRAAGATTADDRRPPHDDHPLAVHAPRPTRPLRRTGHLAELLHRAHLLLG